MSAPLLVAVIGAHAPLAAPSVAKYFGTERVLPLSQCGQIGWQEFTPFEIVVIHSDRTHSRSASLARRADILVRADSQTAAQIIKGEGRGKRFTMARRG
jgi:hypothetical protein